MSGCVVSNNYRGIEDGFLSIFNQNKTLLSTACRLSTSYSNILKGGKKGNKTLYKIKSLKHKKNKKNTKKYKNKKYKYKNYKIN
jgi:hypothetical protein